LKNFLTFTTLITNFFIMFGVMRHWNNMPHQSDKLKASVTYFAPEPEKKEEEYQSLEEALTGEKLKEPEGDPSY